MSDFDLIIAGGTVATASDTFKADVGIRDGRIVVLAAGLKGCRKTIEATDSMGVRAGIESNQNRNRHRCISRNRKCGSGATRARRICRRGELCGQ